MHIFDDLFIAQVINNLISFPILFSIALGILARNIFFILIGAVTIAMAYEIYVSGGSIIAEGLATASVAHLIGALGGFLISKIFR